MSCVSKSKSVVPYTKNARVYKAKKDLERQPISSFFHVHTCFCPLVIDENQRISRFLERPAALELSGYRSCPSDCLCNDDDDAEAFRPHAYNHCEKAFQIIYIYIYMHRTHVDNIIEAHHRSFLLLSRRNACL